MSAKEPQIQNLNFETLQNYCTSSFYTIFEEFSRQFLNKFWRNAKITELRNDVKTLYKDKWILWGEAQRLIDRSCGVWWLAFRSAHQVRREKWPSACERSWTAAPTSLQTNSWQREMESTQTAVKRRGIIKPFPSRPHLPRSRQRAARWSPAAEPSACPLDRRWRSNTLSCLKTQQRGNTLHIFVP